MARVEVCSNCEWGDYPDYFEYDEEEWAKFIRSISHVLDVPNITAIETDYSQGEWVNEDSEEFDFQFSDVSWRQGSTTVMKHYTGGFNVVVSSYCKHNLQDEFWADFIIEA